ncbi:glycosyltransferase [Diaporthe eres]|nr:glycosyltransferase [Diaporthe eres]
MCIPSVEYPEENLPSHFKFGGQLPPKPIPADIQYPEWWGEVLENSARGEQRANRKKIIFVAQGTESPNHLDLVIPAIQGLASRGDLLVIACSCKKGTKLTITDVLPQIPTNTRVIDFFPYDAVLAHVDLFILSSGYGGLNHAVVNGVPVVQTGILIDKPDVGRRIEYAGLGVFIARFPPPADHIRDSVDRVISDDKYRTRLPGGGGVSD